MFNRKRFDYVSQQNIYRNITLSKIKNIHWEMRGNRFFVEIDELEVGAGLKAQLSHRESICGRAVKNMVYEVSITRVK